MSKSKKNNNIRVSIKYKPATQKIILNRIKVKPGRPSPDLAVLQPDGKIMLVEVKAVNNSSLTNEKLSDRRKRLGENIKILEMMGIEKSDSLKDKKYYMYL